MANGKALPTLPTSAERHPLPMYGRGFHGTAEQTTNRQQICHRQATPIKTRDTERVPAKNDQRQRFFLLVIAYLLTGKARYLSVSNSTTVGTFLAEHSDTGLCRFRKVVMRTCNCVEIK